MADAKPVDMLTGALSDPFHAIHMGVTAEHVASRHGITREMQDALALESHQRAERAIAAGRFREQIVPVTIRSRQGKTRFATDEHFRAGAALEDFSQLKPVFARENGTVTAGNAAGINDAAAALVLMEAQTARSRGIEALARLVGCAQTGLDPLYMGVGPIPASQRSATACRAGQDACRSRQRKSPWA